MFLDLIVQVHNMQYIQELAFIFVETFYLHVKDRTRINVDAIVLFDVFCETYFILVFDLHEFTSCVLIFHIGFQLCDLGQVCNPAVADLICNPVRKQRIAVSQKSSLGNTVCLVVEFLRHHFIKVLQLLVLQDLCVELCNTVYRKSCYNSHIRHADLAVHKDSHLLHLFLIARIHFADSDQETAVDLLHNLINTREKSGEQVDGPFLKSLSHNCMVCICTGLCCNIPCLFPA